MNFEGHVLLVQKINQRMGNAFPLPNLEQGAVQPDEERLEWEKHHYDDSPSGHRKPRKSGVIRDDAWKCVQEARAHWRQGRKEKGS